MLKKIAFIVVCCLSMSVFSQEPKFGHINSVEILSMMPEKANIEKSINELNSQWNAELTKLRDEYYTKIKDYQDKMNNNNMLESIKAARQSEITELEKRIAALQKTANEDLQKKQQELFAPVIEKVRKAINEVGAENDLLYIFDLSTQGIIYQSPKSNDITALVKNKLNLK
jgi:outer membrane protein